VKRVGFFLFEDFKFWSNGRTGKDHFFLALDSAKVEGKILAVVFVHWEEFQQVLDIMKTLYPNNRMEIDNNKE
jgi:hypothetical protein